MKFDKELVGEQDICNQIFKYYVISKPSVYGVGIEVEGECVNGSDYVYFTEDKEFAYTVVERMNKGQVTLVSMTEILDDLIL